MGQADLLDQFSIGKLARGSASRVVVKQSDEIPSDCRPFLCDFVNDSPKSTVARKNQDSVP